VVAVGSKQWSFEALNFFIDSISLAASGLEFAKFSLGQTGLSATILLLFKERFCYKCEHP
jgi:hypothetical protein